MKLFDSVINLARKLSLKGKEKDSSLTGLMPLAEVKKVVVIFDADLPESVRTIAAIQDFFEAQGKSVKVFAVTLGVQILSEGMLRATYVHKADINWFGKIKSGESHPQTDTGEDLFISLYAEDTFASEYAARCSNARFKVGRKALSRDVYDLVIGDPVGRELTQLQAFGAISEFLTKIQY